MKITYHSIPLEVVYTYHRPIKGMVESTGAPLTPDEPEEVEIVTVYTEHGDDIAELLVDEQWKDIIGLVKQELED
jgi:hypothetical protein